MSSYTPITASGGQFTATVLAAEFAAIKAAMDELLDRTNATGNEMSANIDLNGNKVLNGAEGVDPSDYVTKAQLDALSLGAGTVTPADVAAVQAQVTSNDGDIFNLQTSDGNQDTAIGTLQSEIIVERNRITANDGDIFNLQTSDGNQDTAIGNLQTNDGLQDTAIGTLQSEIIVERNRITANDGDIVNLQNADITLQNQITNNANKDIAQDVVMGNLATTNTNQDTRMDGIDTRIDTKVVELRTVPLQMSFGIGDGTSLPDASEIWGFELNTPLTIINEIQSIRCLTAPSGGTADFEIKLNGTNIGTATIADGATTGTVTIITPTVAGVVGDFLTLHTLTQNGAADIRISLKANRYDIV